MYRFSSVTLWPKYLIIEVIRQWEHLHIFIYLFGVGNGVFCTKQTTIISNKDDYQLPS